MSKMDKGTKTIIANPRDFKNDDSHRFSLHVDPRSNFRGNNGSLAAAPLVRLLNYERFVDVGDGIERTQP